MQRVRVQGGAWALSVAVGNSAQRASVRALTRDARELPSREQQQRAAGQLDVEVVPKDRVEEAFAVATAVAAAARS